MIENLETGKVVTLDRELQKRNTTLMLMLYGAVAKYGIGMPSDNVLVTAQVPVLQVPANHTLQWEVSEDGKSVLLYIVLNDTKPVDESAANTLVDVGDTAEGDQGVNSDNMVATPPTLEPLPERDLPVEGPGGPGMDDMPPSPAIDVGAADDFEDGIEVGLGD